MTAQGFCLVNSKDPQFMTDYFDRLPFEARQALRESKYDLCIMCALKFRDISRLSWREVVALMEWAAEENLTARELQILTGQLPLAIAFISTAFPTE